MTIYWKYLFDYAGSNYKQLGIVHWANQSRIKNHFLQSKYEKNSLFPQIIITIRNIVRDEFNQFHLNSSCVIVTILRSKSGILNWGWPGSFMLCGEHMSPIIYDINDINNIILNLNRLHFIKCRKFRRILWTSLSFAHVRRKEGKEIMVMDTLPKTKVKNIIRLELMGGQLSFKYTLKNWLWFYFVYIKVVIVCIKTVRKHRRLW